MVFHSHNVTINNDEDLCRVYFGVERVKETVVNVPTNQVPLVCKPSVFGY
jgi:hypothetical protein